jgi:hypothetical protein
MSQLQGSVAGATTIKSVTPDVRAPSRSWSLAFLGGRGPALIAERCGFNDISHFNHYFRILWRGSVVFDAGVNGAKRQDQIQRRYPYDLVTSDNHVGCRWEGAALAGPNMRFVPALCEDEVSLEARQSQIFGGLVAVIGTTRDRHLFDILIN